MATRKTIASAAKKPANRQPKKTASNAARKTATRASKKIASKAVKKTVAKKAVRASSKPGVKAKAVKVAAKLAKKKAVAKKPAKKKVAVKPPGKKATANSTRAALAKKPAKAPARKKASPRHITPEQALANTLALLEAKNEKARQPPGYPSAGDAYTHLQSGDSAESHAASQQHLPPGNQADVIEGHSLPRGNQGKRDQR